MIEAIFNSDDDLLISVIIPSYNHKIYLRQTIESIWSQVYRKIEIVVVDDCSQDDSWELLCELQKESPVKMVIERNSSNSGVAKTFNRAISIANGDLLALFASDDLFADDRFTEAVGMFKDNQSLKIVYANGRTLNDSVIGGRVHSDKVVSLFGENNQYIHKFITTNVSPLFIQSSLIRRDFIEQIGWFDSDILADDWYLNAKIFENIMTNSEFAYLDKDVFYYRVHDTNIHKNYDRHNKLMLEFVENHTPSDYKKEAYSNIYYVIAKRALIHGTMRDASTYLIKSLSSRFVFSRIFFGWKILRALFRR